MGPLTVANGDAEPEIRSRKYEASNHGLYRSTRPNMILGAIAALILDYAGVAAIIVLLVLDRWLRIRVGLGHTLDLLLLVVAAVVVTVSVVAWLAGSRLDRCLARDMSAHTEASPSHSHNRRRSTDSPDT